MFVPYTGKSCGIIECVRIIMVPFWRYWVMNRKICEFWAYRAWRLISVCRCLAVGLLLDRISVNVFSDSDIWIVQMSNLFAYSAGGSSYHPSHSPSKTATLLESRLVWILCYAPPHVSFLWLSLHTPVFSCQAIRYFIFVQNPISCRYEVVVEKLWLQRGVTEL